MENDIGILVSKFRDLSSKILEMMYDDYKKNIGKLSRRTDENVYQLLQARYTNALEKQLHMEVERMIERSNKKMDATFLRHELTNQVSYILSEFLKRANSM